MSGFELFLDGGATALSVLSAAAAALGYKQKACDDAELVGTDLELQELRRCLAESRATVRTEHQALTAAWGAPLSLFEERSVERACASGVPAWAVACLCKARRLADAAAELGDFGDVYDAQLGLAGPDPRGVLRGPVLELAERLDLVALQLRGHVPCVALARREFENARGQVAATAASGAWPALGRVEAAGLPMAILRDRGRLGELWRLHGDLLARVVLGRSGVVADGDEVSQAGLLSRLEALLQAQPELLEEPELASYCQAYLEPPGRSGGAAAHEGSEAKVEPEA